MIISGNSSINKVYYNGYTISKIYACGGSLVWSGDTPTPPTPYSEQYLTFIVKTNGSKFKFSGNTIDYSLDSGSTWTSLPSNTYTPILNSGDTIMWRGSDMQVTSGNGIGNFSTGNILYKYDVEGNVMSLIHGDDFKTATTISSYQFVKLFNGCSGIEDQHIVLPATRVRPHCYEGMFMGCVRMTSAPELPSTTMADYCYYNMFSGCNALTVAPALPATTLASHCYTNMFYFCGFATLPTDYLSATVMADNCYEDMFMKCHNLINAPELSATALADNCYDGMFRECTSLVTAPSLPATTLKIYCYSQMFMGCTSLHNAPELLAPTLVSQCYSQMFEGCSKLNYIKMTATDIASSTAPLMNWVKDVAIDGTFVKNASTTIPTGTSGIPQYWDVIDA